MKSCRLASIPALLFVVAVPLLARAGDTIVRRESLPLVDADRGRAVPVELYQSASGGSDRRKPAIISHGYGGKSSEYGFIAEHLAREGYLVASIQHEVPGDEPLPKTGKPYQTRMPSWQRGVQNIAFVIAELRKRFPDLAYDQLVLVGHSHGGDTSMLFAQEHPQLVHTVISLDSRRMPFPRTQQPRICSIRSSDQVADEGVLPTPDEQARFGMRIVKLAATKHDDMWDGATAEQKAEITRVIDGFLQAPAR